MGLNVDAVNVYHAYFHVLIMDSVGKIRVRSEERNVKKSERNEKKKRRKKKKRKKEIENMKESGELRRREREWNKK